MLGMKDSQTQLFVASSATILEHVACFGSVRRACKAIGIDRETVRQWKLKSPAFAADLAAAVTLCRTTHKEETIAELDDAVITHACNGNASMAKLAYQRLGVMNVEAADGTVIQHATNVQVVQVTADLAPAIRQLTRAALDVPLPGGTAPVLADILAPAIADSSIKDTLASDDAVRQLPLAPPAPDASKHRADHNSQGPTHKP